jgi:cytochrome c peroxidase
MASIANSLNSKNSWLPGVLFFEFYRACRLVHIAPIILLSYFTSSCSKATQPEIAVSQYVAFNIDSLRHQGKVLLKGVASGDEAKVQYQFLKMRETYKRIESVMEYYFPGISRAVNGPALDRLEEGDDKILLPSGFQVIEEMIFPHVVFDSTLARECEILQSSFTRMRELNNTNTFSNANVFEALRLQMLRIMSLGLSGFDSPIALNSIPEAKASLSGIRDIVMLYKDGLPAHEREIWSVLDSRFNNTVEYLSVNSDFNTFDRAVFISKFCNPISESLFQLQLALGIRNNNTGGAFAMTSATFFDTDCYDPRYFAPSYNRDRSLAKIRVGELLFFDPVLSGNNRRSCASCHNPERGFSDGKSTSVAFDFKGNVRRNAPTLINVAFQQNQFWDGRVSFIEDQVEAVLTNPSEMHGSLKDAVETLNASPEYRNLFREAFQTRTVNASHVKMAVASYLRSLTAMNSDFDRFMRGEYDAMSPKQIEGFNIFMGKGKCATCHFMPLFNGTVPPMFSETESEVIGIPAKVAQSNAKPDDDHGKREVVTHSLFDRMFKTPTLRNAALTAPYMHNGKYPTLEDVIDFYDRGGGSGIGLKLPNQTLPSEPLNLNDKEKHALISFIHALTDTTGTGSRPKKLPVLNGVENKRRVGGEY